MNQKIKQDMILDFFASGTSIGLSFSLISINLILWIASILLSVILFIQGFRLSIKLNSTSLEAKEE